MMPQQQYELSDGGVLVPSYMIDNSVDLDGSSEYFSRSFGTAGNRSTFTISTWCKNAIEDVFQVLMSANLSGQQDWTGFTDTNGFRYLRNGSIIMFETTAAFTDTVNHHHYVLGIDTAQAAAADRFTFEVDGVEITDFSTVNYPTQYALMNINSAAVHYMGRLASSNILHLGGLLSEIHFIDGSKLPASEFGQDWGGSWVPKEYTGSYGTKGFFLNFSNSANLGEDMANANDWTGTNISSADQSTDTPTS